MKCLITGSSGHLGEALALTLQKRGDEVVGLDVLKGVGTTRLGSIVDKGTVRDAMRGVEVVFHVATLHKPHVTSHDRQAFVDVNVTGTLNLLEAACEADARAFVFSSTTSAFGDALVPAQGEPAAWIDEDVTAKPKNIYGVTKTAAEDLCQIFSCNEGLDVVVLRTSRFFPEEDDDEAKRAAFEDENLKTNELLYRRVDIEDVVSAHLLAAAKAPALKFRRYVISATTPFAESDLAELSRNAPRVVRRYVPEYEPIYASRGWKMAETIDRVYVNARAQAELAWRPKHDFRSALSRLADGERLASPLAREIGAKGYHREPGGVTG